VFATVRVGHQSWRFSAIGNDRRFFWRVEPGGRGVGLAPLPQRIPRGGAGFAGRTVCCRLGAGGAGDPTGQGDCADNSRDHGPQSIRSRAAGAGRREFRQLIDVINEMLERSKPVFINARFSAEPRMNEDAVDGVAGQLESAIQQAAPGSRNNNATTRSWRSATAQEHRPETALLARADARQFDR